MSNDPKPLMKDVHIEAYDEVHDEETRKEIMERLKKEHGIPSEERAPVKTP